MTEQTEASPAATPTEASVEMPPEPVALRHPSKSERAAAGKAARKRLPLEGHAQLDVAADRPDPVAQLEAQGVTRVPELVPIRYGRMLNSPFAFYRGAAQLMATDLGRVPHSGLHTQLCGDAHVSNFGLFGSPERRLIFDLNDFDETAPGPFEWDVKRFAASLEIATRDNGFSAKVRRRILVRAVADYRQTMRQFAIQGNLEVWYARLDAETVVAQYRDQVQRKRLARTEATIAKARTRDSMQAFNKLTTVVDGRRRIISDPPLIVPLEELIGSEEPSAVFEQLRTLVRSYRSTLQPDRRHLLEQYELIHLARKVVGVGSVGTRAWILLLEGNDQGDPLFLQAKEAQASVLESVTRPSEHENHGRRVVLGQHLMQASSDIFLGWQRTVGLDGVSRDFYIRQLRDWKGAPAIYQLDPEAMGLFARLCAWSLARAHARAGDRVAIASYLGKKDTFDIAVADFAEAYADLNDADYALLAAAVDAGHVKAVRGL